MTKERLNEIQNVLLKHKDNIKVVLEKHGYHNKLYTFDELIEAVETGMDSMSADIVLKDLRIVELEKIETEHNKMMKIGTAEYIKLISSL